MSKYLFRATIGPVQSFIAQARKLQDLYAGSYLLSYFTKHLIHTAEKEQGVVILYPQYDENRTSYPNLFVATVEADSPAGLNVFAEKLENSVREHWRTIAGKVLARWKQEPTVDFTAQIESLLQFYWSAAEYRDGGGYRDASLETLQRMGSAKTTRTFAPLSEPAGRKCSLSAEHNALFYRCCKNESRMVAGAYAVKCIESEKCSPKNGPRKCDGFQLPEVPRKYLDRDKNETLGAVAFVKRCLEFGVDGFDSSFPDIETVAHLARDEDSYYALVVFDGDNMGSHYSSADIKGLPLQEFQVELSNMVSKSSEQMSQAVNMEKGNGVVIYAGGDDFLGAMCLEGVFTTLYELRKSFQNTIDISKYTGRPATFSAGIVIAHVKTPLGEVLRYAREAEALAKVYNDGAKDAYCLTILKHSGEITRYTHSFGLGGDEDGMRLLHNLVDTIVEHKVSTGFVYQLQTEFGRLFKTPAESHCEMLKIELKRILNRAELPKEAKETVVKTICDSINIVIDKSKDDLTSILEFLKSVAFIARQRGGAR